MNRRLLVLLLLLVLSGCGGLPLPSGVREAPLVQAERADTGGTVVVAPGPQPGTTATELVRGYLFALSASPEGGHKIARQYLAPGVECCTGSEAILYPPSSLTITVDPADGAVVRTEVTAVGRILPDGTYRPADTADKKVPGVFRVALVEGQLRLSEVPPGLRVFVGDLERSFTPYDVYFLGRTGRGEPTPSLVPDRVFLPAAAEPAQALVDAVVVRGPSAALAPAVQPAVPPGTTAEVSLDGGVVTVDLSEQVAVLDNRARQRLSAQLVWTLVPAFTGVRLRVAGRPLDPKMPGVQTRDARSVYDPAGVPASAPLRFVQDRRLRRHDDERGAVPVLAQEEKAPPVDEGATAPGTGRLGVRTRRADGTDEIRLGDAAGPLGAPVLTRPGLSSLSWGSGDQGLWVLQAGRPSTVWLVPEAGPDAAAAAPAPWQVPYVPPAGTGPLTRLEVSRDGARVALVLGGLLHVGLVVPSDDGPRIVGIAPVSRELVEVSDVAWKDGTTLIALGAFEAEEQPVPAEVEVDGSSLQVVPRSGGGAPLEVAAGPRLPLVVSAEVEGRRRLFRDNGTQFRQLTPPGTAPFYPG